jgi:hypothetical protein
VLIWKKNKDLCFCMDYRKGNYITKDCFLLPRIDDMLDMPARAKWFSTLDMKSGYWQVVLHTNEKEKTSVLHWKGALAVYHYAFWPLSCSSNVQTPDEVCPVGPNLQGLLGIPG